MNTLLAGVIAGSLHVVSGPDHLAAVAPLAVRNPRAAMRVGALWGAGHATGAALLGALGAVARHVVPIDTVSAWAETLVGGVLLAVGAWAIWQSRRVLVHAHAHAHDEADPSHEHWHIHDAAKPHESRHLHHHTSFGVGVVHGAAGTGHLLGVLPSLALPPAQAATYLAVYGLAAIAAMSLFSGLIGLISARLSPRMVRGAMMGCGVGAMAIGVFWIISGWPG